MGSKCGGTAAFACYDWKYAIFKKVVMSLISIAVIIVIECFK